MSSNASLSFGTIDLPGASGAESLSVALIGPDKTRRSAVASALGEDRRASVREFETYPTQPEEFRWLMEQAFDVIVLDLDSGPDVVLDLLERIRGNSSATSMVYSERAETKLAVRYMRAGAREYLLLPLEKGVVSEAFDRVASRLSERSHPARRAAGNLLVFVCAKGGCGVTTMACNLAIALAGNPEQRTLLIDLALPIGDAALALGVAARYSTEDAIRNAERLDPGLLNELLVRHRSGLFVLAAPSNIPGIEGCDGAIDKLIAVARREFDYVVVDVGSRVDLAGTALFKHASTVYLVTLTGVSDLRNSNRLISKFFPEGGPNLEVVINRFENRLLGAVNEDVVTKALGRPVRWKVPEDRETTREMQFGETGTGDTRVSRLTLEMAGTLTGRPVPQEKQEKKKSFNLKGLARGIADEAAGNDDPLTIKFVPPVIAREIPAIDWPAPAPIPYGSALSPAQLNATASVVGTLVYSPAHGAVLPAGTHKLAVLFTPADGDKYDTAEATVPLKVEKSQPSVEWPNPHPIPYGTTLGSEQLCATASIPGRFDYSPAPGVLLSAGKHTLSAEFIPTDSENYANVQATVLLEVAKETPIVDWPEPKPIDYGTRLDEKQLCATASAPGSFEYSPGPGEVLPAGTHTLTVEFTPADTSNYTKAEATVWLAVAKGTPIVEWTAPASINFGTRIGSKHLCATASIPGKFEYSVAPGTVLPVGTHTLRARFTPADAENYSTVETHVQLTVDKTASVISWPTPDPIPYGTRLGEKQLCAASSAPGKFDYSPAPGTVLAAGVHTLSVTFTPTDLTRFAPAQATVTLHVVKATPAIEWPPLKPALFGTRLSAKQLCASASVPGSFDYSPAPGVVLAAGTHTLTVTFTPADSANYVSAQAAVPLTVVAKATPVITWPNPDAISYGTPLSRKQLCAAASVPGTFDYSAVPGEVLAAGTHSLAVTFTPADTENYASVQTTVALKVAKAVPAIDWPAPKPILDGTLLGAKQLCATAPVPGRFDYSPLPGVALPPGKHTLSAIFTPADRANYAVAQATVPLTVLEKPLPNIAWRKPAPISHGMILGSAQLCATASVPGSFEYAPGPGVALPAGTHTLTVTFTPADTESYATVEAAVPLHVDKATPEIAWPSPDSLPYGAKLGARQLCATASVPGKFEYSPAPGVVLGAGTHTLSATFFPDDSSNYNTAQATVSLQVTRAVPTIEWPAPQSMQCDTALGDAQLCATSPEPGTFDYTPGPGHVLAEGTHTLSVVFTPTDTTNYTPARATVSIQVEVKPAPLIEWPDPDPIPYGTPLSKRQLCATASVPGTFHYSAGAGEVLPVGTHCISVNFIPRDKAAYAAARATVSLKVEKTTPNIDWPAPQPIKPGTPLSALQLDAAAWVPGTFVYSPAADEVLPQGTHTLSVTFTPKDTANYNTAHATVSLRVVAKAVPVITWPKPDSIVYGTALGAAQLCAIASTPGRFNYSPARGEVLAPGMHTLSVTFLPTDADEYLPAQATVELEVEPAAEAIRLPAFPSSEETANPVSATGTQWRDADDAADEFRSAPDWLNVIDEVHSQPVRSVAEVHEKPETASRKWIFAAVALCSILLLALAAIPLFHWGTKLLAKKTLAPAPIATATQVQPDKPKPSPQARAAQTETADTAPEAPVETPTPVQTELMHDQLNAPTRIPQKVQKPTPASAPPPPTNFSMAAAGGLGGGSAISSVFSQKAPRIVAAPPPGPMTISAGVAMGLLIQKKLPAYPLIAREARVSGTVQLEATISKSGTVESLRAISGPAMLRAAAMDAVRTWQYKPYLVNNEPQEVKTTINVDFSLGQ